jgi:hypothetical protein
MTLQGSARPWDDGCSPCSGFMPATTPAKRLGDVLTRFGQRFTPRTPHMKTAARKPRYLTAGCGSRQTATLELERTTAFPVRCRPENPTQEETERRGGIDMPLVQTARGEE